MSGIHAFAGFLIWMLGCDLFLWFAAVSVIAFILIHFRLLMGGRSYD